MVGDNKDIQKKKDEKRDYFCHQEGLLGEEINANHRAQEDLNKKVQLTKLARIDLEVEMLQWLISGIQGFLVENGFDLSYVSYGLGANNPEKVSMFYSHDSNVTRNTLPSRDDSCLWLKISINNRLSTKFDFEPNSMIFMKGVKKSNLNFSSLSKMLDNLCRDITRLFINPDD